MHFSKVAVVYANSLYNFASEKNKIREVSDDVFSVAAIAKQSAELRRIIGNPVIKQSVKLQVIKDITDKNCVDETKYFIHYLFENERIDAVLEIFEAFIALKDEREGLLHADVCSAEKLNAEQKADIISRLAEKYNKRIELTEKIDQSMIGGFIVTVGDTIIDASVKNQLNQIKKKLISASFSSN